MSVKYVSKIGKLNVLPICEQVFKIKMCCFRKYYFVHCKKKKKKYCDFTAKIAAKTNNSTFYNKFINFTAILLAGKLSISEYNVKNKV